MIEITLAAITLVATIINTLILIAVATNIGRLIEHHKFMLEQDSKNLIGQPPFTYGDRALQETSVSKDLKITHLS